MPNIPKFFQTVESYRYSITVALLLLSGALYYALRVFPSIPIGWGSLMTTPGYVVAALFFLSLGMILVRDVWPGFRQLVGLDLTKDEKKQVATEILKSCQTEAKQGQEPPFRVSLRHEEKQKFVTYNFEGTECRVEDDEVVVTESGLEALKEYI